MATEIQLHHIGEVVLAGLLRELAGRGEPNVPCVLHKDCGFSAVLLQAGISTPLTFSANVPLAPVTTDNAALLFDGAHGIDVLCHGAGEWGIAVEAKLGLDRLASATFTTRFLNQKKLTITTHTPRRIKGSMVAILNFRALHDGVALPLRTQPPSRIEIVRPWFLVVRRAVWASWRHARSKVPSFAKEAHVAIFEDIVEQHGDGASFDALVHRLVGSDFYRSWGLGPAT
jgi:hypothetical protein